MGQKQTKEESFGIVGERQREEIFWTLVSVEEPMREKRLFPREGFWMMEYDDASMMGNRFNSQACGFLRGRKFEGTIYERKRVTVD